MNCPLCKEAMLTIELEQVEIDHCTACGGIWLDKDELEMLLGEPQKARILLDSFKAGRRSNEGTRKCPICLKKMDKIAVGAVEPVLMIDKCPADDGLWFDKGELNEITERAQLDKDNKIRKLLTEVFGRTE